VNLRAAFDSQLTLAQSRRIIRSCYKQLGAGMIELLRLPVIDRAYVDRYVRIEGGHHVEDAVASGKPVILLTGHYGNWELSSIVAALRGYPIVALARAQDKLPRLYKLLVSYRESKGCTIVHKGGAMKRLIAALEKRQLVGVVGDQASRQGLFASLFGRPALFATGPFELAYGKDALILPAFIHRVRGPFHRLVVEPPLTLSRHLPKAEAVRAGIEQFAGLLARHINDQPSQWLWMHKRWKHTPARRVLVLSDGKTGHLKQSLAVIEALREHRPELSHDVIDVRYRHRVGRAIALLWSWWMPAGAGAARCLQWTLAPDAASAVLGRYADLIVSCGSSTAPVNLLWSSENDAKSVVIMNPAPLPLRRFSLVIAPRHDGLPRRSNVVQTVGAIVNRMPDESLIQAKGRLQAHPQFQRQAAPNHQRPVIAVFIGGETLHYELNHAFADALIEQVKAGCEAVDGWCLVTTSRRTVPAVERLISERFGRYPRCRLLLIANRDPLDGTMEGMLGAADVAVVTGESISMVSEACASGRRIVVVEPPLRVANRTALTKHQRFLRDLVKEGYVRMVPLPEVGLAVQRTLKERQPAKRLDNYATIREAVATLV
jgi:KDO2-lipid IV(A) lauroyltransferase